MMPRIVFGLTEDLMRKQGCGKYKSYLYQLCDDGTVLCSEEDWG